jgi:hypothetical protein
VNPPSQLDIIRNGRSAQFTIPIIDGHPSHALVIVLTTQICKHDGDQLPEKRCAVSTCRRSYPNNAFLKYGVFEQRAGIQYYVLQDSPRCFRCEPPAADLILYRPGGTTRMILRMRDEAGQPLRVFDRRAHRWVKPETVGVRLMTNSNILRLQPYQDRGHDVTGKPYGQPDARSFRW